MTLKSIANNPEIRDGMTRDGMTRDQIDAAIARHAEVETLYDRPYEDPKRVRVAGRLTVESLSPHHSLSFDTEIGDSAESISATADDVDDSPSPPAGAPRTTPRSGWRSR